MAVRLGSIGRGAVLAAAMAVTGCAEVVMRIPSPFVDCSRVPPGAFEAVDWDAARRVRVSIRHGEFKPSLIRLYQGRPYVMQIENRDRGSRRFQSAEFFAALFIHSVVIEEYGRLSVTCPSGLLALPGGITEVRFIAARDGRYEFSGTVLPFDLGQIPDGIVHIEQAPAIAALLPPAIPGITKPDEDIPAGPYAPASVPVVSPAPETPALPVDPAALPVPLPAPEIPAMPAEPAAAPVVPLPPEIPALPIEPSALPVPPPPEIPAQPVVPSALAPSPPSGEPPPSATPGAPVEPETAPLPAPAPPRSLLPEPAPGSAPEIKPGGVGLFGQ